MQRLIYLFTLLLSREVEDGIRINVNSLLIMQLTFRLIKFLFSAGVVESFWKTWYTPLPGNLALIKA